MAEAAVIIDDDEETDEDPLADFRPLCGGVLSHSLVEEEGGLEVMPTQDMSSVRVLLKDSFVGIPCGTSYTTKKRGRRITRAHAQYLLTAGMLLGIRECVGGLDGLQEAEQGIDVNPAALSEETLVAECEHIGRYHFPPHTRYDGGKPLPCSYEFKAYAPLVFSRIRSAFGVDKQLFLHSICGHFNLVEFVSNAKSGSFFFFSHDGRYMIKTQTAEECKFLQQILPTYYKFLMDNPQTFLTQFYGLYRVKIPETSQLVYFCIMKSVFNTEQEIHKVWDLKGSTKGRRAKPGDSVKKDLDILEEGRKFRVGSETKEAIMAQLRRDATILARLGIMDYSLLAGVHVRFDDDNVGAVVPRTPQKEIPEKEKIRTNTPFRRRRVGEIASHDDYELQDEGSDAGSEEANAFLGEEDDDESVAFACCHLSIIDETYGLLSSALSGIDEECNADRRQVRGTLHAYPPISSREDNGIVSDPNKLCTKEIYFCGIIDILQNYNARKWGETMIRKAAGNSEAEISCVDPETYANRFVKFMSDLLE